MRHASSLSRFFQPINCKTAWIIIVLLHHPNRVAVCGFKNYLAASSVVCVLAVFKFKIAFKEFQMKAYLKPFVSTTEVCKFSCC